MLLLDNMYNNILVTFQYFLELFSIALCFLYTYGVCLGVPFLFTSYINHATSDEDPHFPKMAQARFTELVSQLSTLCIGTFTASGLFFSSFWACLQVQGFSTTQFSRTFGFFCAISSLASIIVGGVTQFALRRYPPENANEWAQAVRKLAGSQCRSAAHLFAIPSVSLVWGMIFFCSFVVISLWEANEEVTHDDSAKDKNTKPLASAFSVTIFMIVVIAHSAVVIRQILQLFHKATESEA